MTAMTAAFLIAGFRSSPRIRSKDAEEQGGSAAPACCRSTGSGPELFNGPYGRSVTVRPASVVGRRRPNAGAFSRP